MRLWVDLRFLLRQPNVGTFETLYVRPFRISQSRQSKHKSGLASAIFGLEPESNRKKSSLSSIRFAIRKHLR